MSEGGWASERADTCEGPDLGLWQQERELTPAGAEEASLMKLLPEGK